MYNETLLILRANQGKNDTKGQHTEVLLREDSFSDLHYACTQALSSPVRWDRGRGGKERWGEMVGGK